MAVELSPTLPPTLRERLRLALDFELAAAPELEPGVLRNNRLHRLEGSDGRRLLLKVYLRDGRHRLEREWAALTFLRQRGFTSVPDAHLHSLEDYYGVYSFESGANKAAADWTPDDARAAGTFAAQLHRISPDDLDALRADFPAAFSATFSYAEQIAGTRKRLAIFADYLATEQISALPQPVRALLGHLDPIAEVERLITAAVKWLNPNEIEARIPPLHRRLNTCDFSPHNILIRPPGHPDGHLCVVDHEYFGWDEPGGLIAGFLTADQALDLSPAVAAAFLDSYISAAPEEIAAATLARLPRVSALMHASWCAIHLQLLTPTLIEKKRFGTPTLEVSTHLAVQIAKLHRRLALARDQVVTLRSSRSAASRSVSAA